GAIAKGLYSVTLVLGAVVTCLLMFLGVFLGD
ncbi:MAG: hypothetical protein RLZZ04_4707, partial [Cyanobacteriota bacterium]